MFVLFDIEVFYIKFILAWIQFFKRNGGFLQFKERVQGDFYMYIVCGCCVYIVVIYGIDIGKVVVQEGGIQIDLQQWVVDDWCGCYINGKCIEKVGEWGYICRVF